MNARLDRAIEAYSRLEAATSHYARIAPTKGARSFDWDEEDHPRAPSGGSDGGQFTSSGAHTMTRAAWHQQEKPKPGYDVTASNKSYWAGVREAASGGKLDEIPASVQDQFKAIFGEALKGPEKTPEPESKSSAERVDAAAAKSAEAIPAEPTDKAIDNQESLPGMEPEKPDETPREAAARQQQALDADYEFARQSKVRNAGADLKGSARHKRNAWRGLADAEENGTAAEFVTRDNLLKAEPHNMLSKADKHPLTAMAMHFALRAFPPKPGYGRTAATANDRKDYVDAYQQFKAKAEELA